MRVLCMVAVAAALGLLVAGPVAAATKTATIGLQVVVLPGCSVGSADGSGGVAFGSLDFGTHYDLGNTISVVGQQSAGAIRVNCVAGVDYRIVMDGGGSGSVSARQMSGGSGEVVNYNLYTDSSYSTVWDDSVGVALVGDGDDQWTPVYGRVLAQATPSAGTYTDTVVVTVSW